MPNSIPYQKYCNESKIRGISNGVKIYLKIKPPIIKKTRHAIVFPIPISVSNFTVLISFSLFIIKNE
tara:strand:- start:12345 stop:12545 length:201 start_codon:yes stop_codon:yes gene_type:complete